MKYPGTCQLRAAIVGASTLKGTEVKAVLSERKFPIAKMVLMDTDEDLGRLTAFDGEPVFSMAIEEDSFDFLDLVFFAADPKTTRTYAHLAREKSFLLIDLSHAFSKDQKVPLYLEALNSGIQAFQGVVCSPHPAVISVASILNRLSFHYETRNVVVTILEPASERGKAGIEELEQQTLNIFSFQPVPQIVFDKQLAFNLLARLGKDAKENLMEVERIISSQLPVLLQTGCPLPALTVIQASIFHAHAFSFFVEIDQAVEIKEVEDKLRSDLLTVIETSDEPPSPIQVAGTDLIQIGGMKRDPLNSRGLWFWAVSDNLRLAAINAVAAAESILLR